MLKYSYRLIFLFFFVCSISSVSAQAANAENDTTTAEDAIILSNPESELLLQNDASIDGKAVAGDSLFFLLLKLVFFLVILSAAVYGVLYLIRRSKRFTVADDPFLKQVAALTLAPDKNLYVVTLIDKAYLVGVCASSLSLIAEVTDRELIDAMSLHAAETADEKQDFSSLLHTFFPAAAHKKNDSNLFTSFLSTQRERLHKSAITSAESDQVQVENEERT